MEPRQRCENVVCGTKVEKMLIILLFPSARWLGWRRRGEEGAANIKLNWPKLIRWENGGKLWTVDSFKELSIPTGILLTIFSSYDRWDNCHLSRAKSFANIVQFSQVVICTEYSGPGEINSKMSQNSTTPNCHRLPPGPSGLVAKWMP